MMASIAGGTRVGRVCSVAFGLIARRVGRVTRIAMVGCASGRTRTIERDTKGAKTRFIAPAYGKFESISLRQRVRLSRVPRTLSANHSQRYERSEKLVRLGVDLSAHRADFRDRRCS